MLLLVDDLEGIWIISGQSSGDKLSPDALDVALQLLIANYWHLAFNLGSSLASELNILLFGKEIPTRLDFLRTVRCEAQTIEAQGPETTSLF